jgi:hypothetical protein
LFERLFESCNQLGAGSVCRRWPGHDNESTAGKPATLTTEVIAKHTFDPVADHRTGVDFARHRKTDAGSAVIG